MFQYDEDVSQHDDDDFVCCITYVHCGPSENLMRSIAMRHDIKSFFQRANNNDDGT